MPLPPFDPVLAHGKPNSRAVRTDVPDFWLCSSPLPHANHYAESRSAEPGVKFPHRTFVILTFTGKLVLATHAYELAPNFYALDPLATTTRFETPNWAATWLVPNMVHNLTMSVLLIGFGRV